MESAAEVDRRRHSLAGRLSASLALSVLLCSLPAIAQGPPPIAWMGGGHSGGGHTAVAATSDGYLWTASSSDRTFKKWSLPRLGLTKTLLVDFAQSSVPAIARNGKVVAVAGSAGIGVFQTSDGALLHNYPTGDYGLGRPSLSADGQTISFEVSAGGLNYVVVGSLPHKTQTTIASAAQAFGLYAVAPDGKTVVVRDPSGNGALNLYRASDASFVGSLAGSSGVDTVAYSADSQFLAAVSGSTIHIWRLAGLQKIQLIDASSPVAGAALSSDGLLLASVDASRTRVWNVSTGASVSTLAQGGRAVDFSLDGRSLAVLGSDSKLHQLAVSGGSSSTSGHSGTVTAVAYSPDGSMVASASADSSIDLRSTADGRLLATLSGHTGSVHSIAFSPTGGLLVSGGSDHTVKVWDISTYTLARTLSGHGASVGAVAFSPNGASIASGSAAPESAVRLWDVATGGNTRTFPGSPDSVTSLAFSPDGDTLTAGTQAGVARRWNVLSGSLAASYFAPGAGSMSLAFSPDGTRLAAGWSSKVLIFEAAQGTLLHTIDAHGKDGTVVSYAPNGESILSGNPDGTVKIWSASNQSLVSMYDEETYAAGSGVTSVSYSADNIRLVYGRADATIVAAFTSFVAPVIFAGVDDPATQLFPKIERRDQLAMAMSPQAGIASVLPAAVNVIPAAGSALSQTFSFTFSHPGGAESLGILNILVNRFLDGQQSCYIAYVPAGLNAGTVLLVKDGGNPTDLEALPIPGSGTVANSQCTINGTGSSVTGSGNTMTLTLSMTFSAAFAGNKVVYMAARDNASGNSGWQALGVWNVPGTAPTGPSVVGVTPARSSTAAQPYTFTFAHSAGFANLFIVNTLVNQFLDGRDACYVAYIPSGPTTGTVALVADNGDGGDLSYMALPGGGSVQNSQCTITGVGSSASASGNNLTLTLAITFNQAFSGNRVIYAAARTTTGTSDWQAVGTVTVPGAPSQILATGGSPQTAPVNTPFGSALMATVTDVNGNPVGGVTVTFTAPAGGAGGSFLGGNNTAVTNSAGVATSAQFTANGIAGSYFVTASVGAVGPVNFSLANTSGGSGVINVANATIGKDLQDSILITLNPAAPSGGVTLTIQSGDPAKVLVGGGSSAGSSTLSAPISEGSALISTTVQALAGSGTVNVTISAPGYAATTSTITLAPSGFVVSGPNGIGASFNTFQGATTPLTVSSGRLNSSGVFAQSQQLRGGFSTNVAISSSAPGIGTVSSPSVAFNGGFDSASVNFVAGGSSTGNTNIVLAAPSGFNTPTVGASLTATVQQSGFVPFTALVGQGLQVPANISLTGVASSNVAVTLTSNDPSKLRFATTTTDPGTTSIVVNIPSGFAGSSDFYVQALSNTGTVGYTATAAGFGSTVGSVTLASAGLLIESPGGQGATAFQAPIAFGDANIRVHTGRVDAGGNFVEGQLVAGGGSVSVTVVSSNTSVGTITSSPITVVGGSSSALTHLHPVTAGTTTVTVSAPSFGSRQVNATITPSNLFVTGVSPGIGNGLQKTSQVLLPAAAGVGGVPVTVQTSSPLLALATTDTGVGSSSIVVTVPQGASSATFYVQALGNAGSGKYTASATGYGPATSPDIFVGKSAVVIAPPTTVSRSLSSATYNTTVFAFLIDASNVLVEAQSVAAIAVTVPVQSTNTGTATVPATVTIAPGSQSAPLTASLVAAGTTTVSVTQPAGFSVPTAFTSIALTVTAP